MSDRPGSAARPLRVAVVGAGPAGFYVAEALLKQPGLVVDIDLLERLPVPFGLLRYGVAPDHPKIKSIAVAYERIGSDARVRFLGNVAVGGAPAAGPGLDDLLACYDQVVLATGAEDDRRLGIPGEDLAGSLPATRFVAWYNGHPDHQDLAPDLSCARAVVVGVGDVALDLARLLLRDPDGLAATDITADALDAFRRSRVDEVVLLARRGPAATAFAAKELEDVGELEGIDVVADADLIERDLAALDPHDTSGRHLLELMATLARRPRREGARRLVLRFLASPVELVAADGRVAAVFIEDNELLREADGSTRARGTGRRTRIEAGLVLRSVGYLGRPVSGLPFDEAHGIVPNADGRVLADGRPRPRVYAAGWIRRGATGVVGTNKGDAAHTVAAMMADLPGLDPVLPGAAVERPAIDARLAAMGIRVVTWEGWRRIDAAERERGRAAGKPREKLVSVDELLDVAGA